MVWLWIGVSFCPGGGDGGGVVLVEVGWLAKWWYAARCHGRMHLGAWVLSTLLSMGVCFWSLGANICCYLGLRLRRI